MNDYNLFDKKNFRKAAKVYNKVNPGVLASLSDISSVPACPSKVSVCQISHFSSFGAGVFSRS
jgi:hypothetical protein